MYFIKKVPRKAAILNISNEQTESSPFEQLRSVGFSAAFDLGPPKARLIEMKSPFQEIGNMQPNVGSSPTSGPKLKLKKPREVSPSCQPVSSVDFDGSEELLSPTRLGKKGTGFLNPGVNRNNKGDRSPHHKRSVSSVYSSSRFDTASLYHMKTNNFMMNL